MYEIRTHKYRAKGRGSTGRGRHSALNFQVGTNERNTQVNKQPTMSNTVSPERGCPVTWAALLSPTPGSGSASWLGRGDRAQSPSPADSTLGWSPGRGPHSTSVRGPLVAWRDPRTLSLRHGLGCMFKAQFLVLRVGPGAPGVGRHAAWF